MTTETRKTSADVSLELIPSAPRTQERLEDDAFRLLDAINSEVPELALGATVGCDFDRSVIDLLFTVEAAGTTEVYRKISVVTEVIERTFVKDEVRASAAPSEHDAHSALCH